MVDYLPDGRQLQFNLATQAHRSTGSAFKPITLATALERGRLALLDLLRARPDLTSPTRSARTRTAPGTCTTPPTRPAGTIEPPRRDRQLREHDLRAARSRRSASRNVKSMAHQLGITSSGRYFKPVCAITLGSVGFTPLEMTDVYATIASGGVHHDPQAFETRPRAEREGDRQAQRDRPADARSERRRRARRTRCRDVIQHGTGTAAAISAGRPPARPGRPRTSRTRGSAATCRSSRRASGSAIRPARSRSSTSRASARSSAARCRRRSGTSSWARQSPTSRSSTSRRRSFSARTINGDGTYSYSQSPSSTGRNSGPPAPVVLIVRTTSRSAPLFARL